MKEGLIILTISTESFGQGMLLYTLTNKNGVTLKATDFGARIVALDVPLTKNESRSLVLGFPSADEYLSKDLYFGATIGRTAGRIADGSFELAGKKYQTMINTPTQTTLHGGTPGFESKKWHSEIQEAQANPSVKFWLESPAGENGFPGNLTVSVTYTLTEENEWQIEYQATTDEQTLFNPTNHVYFNLTGNPTIPIDAHELQINAQKFVPLDERVLPLGELASVDQTAFDLQKPKKLAEVFSSTDEQIQKMNGFDHPFILTNHDLINPDVILKSPTKDITLEMFTDQPSVVIFSANFADNGPDIQGQKLVNHGALTFETQVCPVAERFPLFGSIILSPEQEFHSTTRFKLIY